MASSDNVILSFTAFDLETGTDCQYDYLEVRSATGCFWGVGGARWGGGGLYLCVLVYNLWGICLCVSACACLLSLRCTR